MATERCAICNAEYEVCNFSVQSKTRPWRVVVDTLEHYMIYLAIHGYTISKNKAKAKEELEKCNLSDVDTFLPEVQAAIKEILADDAKDTAEKPQDSQDSKKDPAEDKDGKETDQSAGVNQDATVNQDVTANKAATTSQTTVAKTSTRTKAKVKK